MLPGHHHITGDIASHYRRNTGVIAGHDAVGHTHASHCMGRRERYMHVRAGGTLKLYTERTAKKAWCTTPSAWPRCWKKLYLMSSQGSKDKSSCNNSTEKAQARRISCEPRLHGVRSIECSYIEGKHNNEKQGHRSEKQFDAHGWELLGVQGDDTRGEQVGQTREWHVTSVINARARGRQSNYSSAIAREQEKAR